MAIALNSTNFVTWDEYIDERNTQDRHLKQELENLYNCVDAAREELQGTIEAVKQDVAGLKGDVAELKMDVAELKTDVAELKVDFKRIDGVSYNRALRNPTLRLAPIVTYLPGEGMVTPKVFPRNARDFYKLKTPATTREMSILIYLVQFYDIQGYQTWEADARAYEEDTSGDGEVDERPSSQESISLEGAVRQHPDIAVDALSAIVGLLEENFVAFRARAAEYRERHKQPVAKRQGISGKGESKRQRLEIRHSTPSHMPPGAVHSPIPLENLINVRSKSTSKEPSERTRLEWNHDPYPERTGPTLQDPYGKGKKFSIQTDDGSPTDSLSERLYKER